MQKLTTNTRKIMKKIKNRHIFSIGMYVYNLYGWAMSQNLPLNNFEWIKNTSQFNKDFIKHYNEEIDERYFLKVDIQYLEERLHELHND